MYTSNLHNYLLKWSNPISEIVSVDIPMVFTSIKTKGISDSIVGRSYVKKYYVSYANQTGQWTTYTKDNKKVEVRKHLFRIYFQKVSKLRLTHPNPSIQFTAAFDESTNHFSSFVKASYLRIHPTDAEKTKSGPCMQTAVYGCDPSKSLIKVNLCRFNL